MFKTNVDGQMDRLTDGQTFAFLELLSQLKIRDNFQGVPRMCDPGVTDYIVVLVF